MKDDYFVMFKKISITLVFNALICKYEYIHTMYIQISQLYADRLVLLFVVFLFVCFFGWFCMYLYMVNDNLFHCVMYDNI